MCVTITGNKLRFLLTSKYLLVGDIATSKLNILLAILPVNYYVAIPAKIA